MSEGSEASGTGAGGGEAGVAGAAVGMGNRHERRARRARRRQAGGSTADAAEASGAVNGAPLEDEAEHDTLTLALAFAAAQSGEKLRTQLRQAGLEESLIERVFDPQGPEAKRMRQLALIGELYDRRLLGRLLRARLAELLAGAQKAQELQALSRTAHSLPAWAFDGEAEAGAAEVGNLGQLMRSAVGRVAGPARR